MEEEEEQPQHTVTSDPDAPPKPASGDVGPFRPERVRQLERTLPPAAILHSDLSKSKSSEDVLGFSLYAKAIAEFIDQKQTAPPLTIAILAPWGRGKTSLMRLLRDELTHKVISQATTQPPRASGTIRTWVRALRESAARKRPQKKPTPAPELPRPKATFGNLRDWLRKTIDLKPVRLPYPTVWFNAWKFQSSEQVWAGLAHEIINQLVEQLPDPVEREKFWLTLQLRRLDSVAVLRDLRGAALERIAGQIFSWATLGVLVVVAATVALVLGAIAKALALTVSPALGASVLATTGTVGTLLVQTFYALRELKARPLEGTYARYVHQPDYAGQRGMLSEVEEDIRIVFDLLVDKDYPAVIFIDDLDRCSPGKVAEVMEAMNLFLSGDFPNCYFVIGMDAQVVAASMDVAHKELTRKLAFVARGYGSLGWYFMDKFVQLPFVIPSLSETQRSAFLGTLFTQPQRPTPRSDALAVQAQQAIEALKASKQATSDLVQQAAQVIAPLHKEDAHRARKIAEQALEAGAKRFRDDDPEILGELGHYAEYLGRAPRTIKRFANLYRFYRMVQWSRQLQGYETVSALALGRWLTVMLRWPQLVRWIQWEGEAQLFPKATDPAQRAAAFESCVMTATSHSEWLEQNELRSVPWCADAQLFDFLRKTGPNACPLSDALDQGVW